MDNRLRPRTVSDLFAEIDAERTQSAKNPFYDVPDYDAPTIAGIASKQPDDIRWGEGLHPYWGLKRFAQDNPARAAIAAKKIQEHQRQQAEYDYMMKTLNASPFRGVERETQSGQFGDPLAWMRKNGYRSLDDVPEPGFFASDEEKANYNYAQAVKQQMEMYELKAGGINVGRSEGDEGTVAEEAKKPGIDLFSSLRSNELEFQAMNRQYAVEQVGKYQQETKTQLIDRASKAPIGDGGILRDTMADVHLRDNRTNNPIGSILRPLDVLRGGPNSTWSKEDDAYYMGLIKDRKMMPAAAAKEVEAGKHKENARMLAIRAKEAISYDEKTGEAKGDLPTLYELRNQLQDGRTKSLLSQSNNFLRRWQGHLEQAADEQEQKIGALGDIREGAGVAGLRVAGSIVGLFESLARGEYMGMLTPTNTPNAYGRVGEALGKLGDGSAYTMYDQTDRHLDAIIRAAEAHNEETGRKGAKDFILPKSAYTGGGTKDQFAKDALPVIGVEAALNSFLELPSEVMGFSSERGKRTAYNKSLNVRNALKEVTGAKSIPSMTFAEGLVDGAGDLAASLWSPTGKMNIASKGARASRVGDAFVQVGEKILNSASKTKAVPSLTKIASAEANTLSKIVDLTAHNATTFEKTAEIFRTVAEKMGGKQRLIDVAQRSWLEHPTMGTALLRSLGTSGEGMVMFAIESALRQGQDENKVINSLLNGALFGPATTASSAMGMGIGKVATETAGKISSVGSKGNKISVREVVNQMGDVMGKQSYSKNFDKVLDRNFSTRMNHIMSEATEGVGNILQAGASDLIAKTGEIFKRDEKGNIVLDWEYMGGKLGYTFAVGHLGMMRPSAMIGTPGHKGLAHEVSSVAKELWNYHGMAKEAQKEFEASMQGKSKYGVKDVSETPHDKAKESLKQHILDHSSKMKEADLLDSVERAIIQANKQEAPEDIMSGLGIDESTLNDAGIDPKDIISLFRSSKPEDLEFLVDAPLNEQGTTLRQLHSVREDEDLKAAGEIAQEKESLAPAAAIAFSRGRKKNRSAYNPDSPENKEKLPFQDYEDTSRPSAEGQEGTIIEESLPVLSDESKADPEEAEAVKAEIEDLQAQEAREQAQREKDAERIDKERSKTAGQPEDPYEKRSREAKAMTPEQEMARIAIHKVAMRRWAKDRLGPEAAKSLRWSTEDDYMKMLRTKGMSEEEAAREASVTNAYTDGAAAYIVLRGNDGTAYYDQKGDILYNGVTSVFEELHHIMHNKYESKDVNALHSMTEEGRTAYLGDGKDPIRNEEFAAYQYQKFLQSHVISPEFIYRAEQYVDEAYPDVQDAGERNRLVRMEAYAEEFNQAAMRDIIQTQSGNASAFDALQRSMRTQAGIASERDLVNAQAYVGRLDDAVILGNIGVISKQTKQELREKAAETAASLSLFNSIYNKGKASSYQSFFDNNVDGKSRTRSFYAQPSNRVIESQELLDGMAAILDLPVAGLKQLIRPDGSIGAKVRTLLGAESTVSMIRDFDRIVSENASESSRNSVYATDRSNYLEGLTEFARKFQEAEVHMFADRSNRYGEANAKKWLEKRKGLGKMFHKAGMYALANKESHDEVLSIGEDGSLLTDANGHGYLLTGPENRAFSSREHNLNPSRYIPNAIWSANDKGFGASLGKMKWRMVVGQGSMYDKTYEQRTDLGASEALFPIMRHEFDEPDVHGTKNPVHRGIVLGITDAKAKEVALDVSDYLDTLVHEGILATTPYSPKDIGKMGAENKPYEYYIPIENKEKYEARMQEEWGDIFADMLKSQTFLGSDPAFKFKVGSNTESAFDYIRFDSSTENGQPKLEAVIRPDLLQKRVNYLIDKAAAKTGNAQLGSPEFRKKQYEAAMEALRVVKENIDLEANHAYINKNKEPMKGKLFDFFFNPDTGIARFTDNGLYGHTKYDSFFPGYDMYSDPEQVGNFAKDSLFGKILDPEYLASTISNLTLFHVQRTMDSGYKFMKAKVTKDKDGKVVYSEIPKLATKYVSSMLHTEASAMTSDFNYFSDVVFAIREANQGQGEAWDILEFDPQGNNVTLAQTNPEGKFVEGLYMRKEKDGTPKIVRRTFVFDQDSMKEGLLGEETQPRMMKDAEGNETGKDFNDYIRKAIEIMSEGNVDGATIHFKPKGEYYTPWDFAAHVNGQSPDFALKTRWLSQVSEGDSHVGTINYKHAEHQEIFNQYATIEEAMSSPQAQIDPIGAAKHFMYSRLWDNGITSLSNTNSLKGSGTHTPRKDGTGAYGEHYFSPSQDGGQFIINRNERYGSITPEGLFIEKGVFEVPIIGKDAMWFHSQKRNSKDESGRVGVTNNSGSDMGTLAPNLGSTFKVKIGQLEFGGDVSPELLADNGMFTIDQAYAHVVKESLQENAEDANMFSRIYSGTYDPIDLNSGDGPENARFHKVLGEMYKRAQDGHFREESEDEFVSDGFANRMMYFMEDFTEPIIVVDSRGNDKLTDSRRLVAGKEESFRLLNPLASNKADAEYFYKSYQMNKIKSPKGIKATGSYSVYKPDVDATMSIYRGIERLQREMEYARSRGEDVADLERRIVTMQEFHEKVKETGTLSLNEPLLLISEDLAEQYGWQIGDRAFVGAIPKDSATPDVPLIIGGIIEGQKNSVSMGSELGFIMGKDHDIDALNVITNTGAAKGEWDIPLKGRNQESPEMVDAFGLAWNAAFAHKWHVQDHVEDLKRAQAQANAEVYRASKKRFNEDLQPLSPRYYDTMRYKVGSDALGTSVVARNKIATISSYDDFNMRLKAYGWGGDPYAISTDRAGRMSRKEVNWRSSIAVQAGVDMFDTSPFLSQEMERALNYTRPGLADTFHLQRYQGEDGEWYAKHESYNWKSGKQMPFAPFASDMRAIMRGDTPPIGTKGSQPLDHFRKGNNSPGFAQELGNPFSADRPDENIANTLIRDIGMGLSVGGGHWIKNIFPDMLVHPKAVLAEMFLRDYDRFSRRFSTQRGIDQDHPYAIRKAEQNFFETGNIRHFFIGANAARVFEAADNYTAYFTIKPDKITYKTFQQALQKHIHSPFEKVLYSAAIANSTNSKFREKYVESFQGTFAKMADFEGMSIEDAVKKTTLFDHLKTTTRNDPKIAQGLYDFVNRELKYINAVEGILLESRMSEDAGADKFAYLDKSYMQVMDQYKRGQEIIGAFDKRGNLPIAAKNAVAFNIDRYTSMEETYPSIVGLLSLSRLLDYRDAIFDKMSWTKDGVQERNFIVGDKTLTLQRTVSDTQPRHFLEDLGRMAITVKKTEAVDGVQEIIGRYSLGNLDDVYDLSRTIPTWSVSMEVPSKGGSPAWAESSDTIMLKAWTLMGQRERTPYPTFISPLHDVSVWKDNKERLIRESTDAFISSSLGEAIIRDAIARNPSSGADSMAPMLGRLKEMYQIATEYERQIMLNGKEFFSADREPVLPGVVLNAFQSTEEYIPEGAFIQPLTTAVESHIDSAAVDLSSSAPSYDPLDMHWPYRGSRAPSMATVMRAAQKSNTPEETAAKMQAPSAGYSRHGVGNVGRTYSYNRGRRSLAEDVVYRAPLDFNIRVQEGLKGIRTSWLDRRDDANFLRMMKDYLQKGGSIVDYDELINHISTETLGNKFDKNNPTEGQRLALELAKQTSTVLAQRMINGQFGQSEALELIPHLFETWKEMKANADYVPTTWNTNPFFVKMRGQFGFTTNGAVAGLAKNFGTVKNVIDISSDAMMGSNAVVKGGHIEIEEVPISYGTLMGYDTEGSLNFGARVVGVSEMFANMSRVFSAGYHMANSSSRNAGGQAAKHLYDVADPIEKGRAMELTKHLARSLPRLIAAWEAVPSGKNPEKFSLIDEQGISIDEGRLMDLLVSLPLADQAGIEKPIGQHGFSKPVLEATVKTVLGMKRFQVEHNKNLQVLEAQARHFIGKLDLTQDGGLLNVVEGLMKELRRSIDDTRLDTDTGSSFLPLQTPSKQAYLRNAMTVLDQLNKYHDTKASLKTPEDQAKFDRSIKRLQDILDIPETIKTVKGERQIETKELLEEIEFRLKQKAHIQENIENELRDSIQMPTLDNIADSFKTMPLLYMDFKGTDKNEFITGLTHEGVTSLVDMQTQTYGTIMSLVGERLYRKALNERQAQDGKRENMVVEENVLHSLASLRGVKGNFREVIPKNDRVNLDKGQYVELAGIKTPNGTSYAKGFFLGFRNMSKSKEREMVILGADGHEMAFKEADVLQVIREGGHLYDLAVDGYLRQKKQSLEAKTIEGMNLNALRDRPEENATGNEAVRLLYGLTGDAALLKKAGATFAPPLNRYKYSGLRAAERLQGMQAAFQYLGVKELLKVGSYALMGATGAAMLSMPIFTAGLVGAGAAAMGIIGRTSMAMLNNNLSSTRDVVAFGATDFQRRQPMDADVLRRSAWDLVQATTKSMFSAQNELNEARVTNPGVTQIDSAIQGMKSPDVSTFHKIAKALSVGPTRARLSFEAFLKGDPTETRKVLSAINDYIEGKRTGLEKGNEAEALFEAAEKATFAKMYERAHQSPEAQLLAEKQFLERIIGGADSREAMDSYGNDLASMRVNRRAEVFNTMIYLSTLGNRLQQSEAQSRVMAEHESIRLYERAANKTLNDQMSMIVGMHMADRAVGMYGAQNKTKFASSLIGSWATLFQSFSKTNNSFVLGKAREAAAVGRIIKNLEKSMSKQGATLLTKGQFKKSDGSAMLDYDTYLNSKMAFGVASSVGSQFLNIIVANMLMNLFEGDDEGALAKIGTFMRSGYAGAQGAAIGKAGLGGPYGSLVGLGFNTIASLLPLFTDTIEHLEVQAFGNKSMAKRQYRNYANNTINVTDNAMGLFGGKGLSATVSAIMQPITAYTFEKTREKFPQLRKNERLSDTMDYIQGSHVDKIGGNLPVVSPLWDGAIRPFLEISHVIHTTNAKAAAKEAGKKRPNLPTTLQEDIGHKLRRFFK